jgi:hypothetical protein
MKQGAQVTRHAASDNASVLTLDVEHHPQWMKNVGLICFVDLPRASLYRNLDCSLY